MNRQDSDGPRLGGRTIGGRESLGRRAGCSQALTLGRCCLDSCRRAGLPVVGDQVAGEHPQRDDAHASAARNIARQGGRRVGHHGQRGRRAARDGTDRQHVR